MGQKQHSRRKVSTPDIGMVIVAGNFPSGAQEDDSFPDSALLDGYVAKPEASAPNDAYGSGFKGVLRVGLGMYDIVLDRVYPELLSAHGSVHTSRNKSAQIQFLFPMMETADPSTGEDVSVVRLRVQNGSGVDIDLQYNERISFILTLRNTSV